MKTWQYRVIHLICLIIELLGVYYAATTGNFLVGVLIVVWFHWLEPEPSHLRGEGEKKTALLENVPDHYLSMLALFHTELQIGHEKYGTSYLIRDVTWMQNRAQGEEEEHDSILNEILSGKEPTDSVYDQLASEAMHVSVCWALIAHKYLRKNLYAESPSEPPWYAFRYGMRALPGRRERGPSSGYTESFRIDEEIAELFKDEEGGD